MPAAKGQASDRQRAAGAANLERYRTSPRWAGKRRRAARRAIRIRWSRARERKRLEGERMAEAMMAERDRLAAEQRERFPSLR